MVMKTLGVMLLVVAGLFGSHVVAEESTPGATRILHWPDGKKAAFYLAFDDSCPSHVRTVVPELKKRKLTGTFYIIPGNGAFKGQAKAWEKDIPGSGIVYANHTYSHKGAVDAVSLEKDLAKSNEVIHRCFPERKPPYLISFGRPGGVPWKVSKEDKERLLKKYNLIERLPFYGPPIHYKTAKSMLDAIDKVLGNGGVGHFDFHGVGGDWLVTPVDSFIAVLDKLSGCSDRLWVTDPVSIHKYQVERSKTSVKVIKSTPKEIVLKLESDVDAKLYDQPLSLETRVPKNWKSCSYIQGGKKVKLKVIDGLVKYNVLPTNKNIKLMAKN